MFLSMAKDWCHKWFGYKFLCKIKLSGIYLGTEIVNKVNSIQNVSFSFLEATSEQKQFYSEFSFSFLQASSQQNQFDSELSFLKGKSEQNQFYADFSSKRNFWTKLILFSICASFPKGKAEKIICPEIRTVPFVSQAGNSELKKHVWWDFLTLMKEGILFSKAHVCLQVTFVI